MAVVKLSAPVGLATRTDDGPAVRNKSADVIVLRKMLSANGGGELGETGSVDAGLLKALEKYQRKIGMKKPDQIVDPGGKTEKALFPKYSKAVKEAEKVIMVKVRWKGQDLMMTEKDHARMQQEIFKNLDGYIKSLVKGHKLNLKTFQDYLDTAQLKDGIMNAVAQAIIMTAGSVKYPDSKVVGKSISAMGALERAVMSKDLKALNTALPEAERALRAFDAEVLRFLNDFIGSAKTTGTVCNVTSGVAFGIVGVLATPVLVTAAGMSAATATVVSAGSVAVVQSSAQELGKHASGKKLTAWDSVKSVAFGKQAASYFSGKLAANVTMLSSKKAEELLVKYFLGAGQETLKSAISEGAKMMGNMAKTGKVPTEKDFNAAVMGIVAGGAFGGMVSSLSKFNKSWTYKNKALLTDKMLPERFAKLAKSNDIPATIRAKIWADVLGKVEGEAGKAGFNAVVGSMKGDEKSTALEKQAEKALLKDRQIQTLVDKEMKKAMKKYKVEAK